MLLHAGDSVSFWVVYRDGGSRSVPAESWRDAREEAARIEGSRLAASNAAAVRYERARLELEFAIAAEREAAEYRKEAGARFLQSEASLNGCSKQVRELPPEIDFSDADREGRDRVLSRRYDRISALARNVVEHDGFMVLEIQD